MEFDRIINIEYMKRIAKELNYPEWLVELLVNEYLDCRLFLYEDNSIQLDYNCVSKKDILAIEKPYVFLNGITLFHNVTEDVFKDRHFFSKWGLPVSKAAKEFMIIPEGRVSPYYHRVTEHKSNLTDWRLSVNIYEKAVIYYDSDEIYQWSITSLLKPYQLNVLKFLHDLIQAHLHQQSTVPISKFKKNLVQAYSNLENFRDKMRKTAIANHEKLKAKPGTNFGYTKESPPRTTIFDEFTLEEKPPHNTNSFLIRSHLEIIFFRAAYRAMKRAQEAQDVLIKRNSFNTSNGRRNRSFC